MTITGYYNSSPPNKINKALTSLATYEGSLKQSCSTTAPVITIQLASVPNNLNYCYIAEFQRFYFITDITYEITGLYTITCSIDPIESFKTQILALTAVIERQEKQYNLYLKDPMFRTEQPTHTQFIEFTNGFGTDPVVLLSTI